jgi:hypothetical protein
MRNQPKKSEMYGKGLMSNERAEEKSFAAAVIDTSARRTPVKMGMKMDAARLSC